MKADVNKLPKRLVTFLENHGALKIFLDNLTHDFKIHGVNQEFIYNQPKISYYAFCCVHPKEAIIRAFNWGLNDNEINWSELNVEWEQFCKTSYQATNQLTTEL